MIASSISMPSSLNLFMQSTRTIALLTTTPISITNPIIETTLTSWPHISSASMPPVNASGIVNSTMNGERSDWNCATIIR